jgi:membrane protein YdbS with pleckstrin-like domain
MEQQHHTTHGAKSGNDYKGVTARRVLKLLLAYLTISLAVAAWIDYSSYEVLNPLWTVLAAVVAAVVVTVAHLYHGQRNGDGDR